MAKPSPIFLLGVLKSLEGLQNFWRVFAGGWIYWSWSMYFKGVWRLFWNLLFDFSPTAIALESSAVVKVSGQNCFRTLYGSLGQLGYPLGLFFQGTILADPFHGVRLSSASSTSVSATSHRCPNSPSLPSSDAKSANPNPFPIGSLRPLRFKVSLRKSIPSGNPQGKSATSGWFFSNIWSCKKA